MLPARLRSTASVTPAAAPVPTETRSKFCSPVFQFKSIRGLGRHAEEEEGWIVVRRQAAVDEDEAFVRILLVPVQNFRREKNGSGCAGANELPKRDKSIAIFAVGIVVPGKRVGADRPRRVCRHVPRNDEQETAQSFTR